MYQLYKYKDYKEYVEIQKAEGKRKSTWINVDERNIEFLSAYITELVGKPEFGLCHGTRYGREQEYFSKYLGCKVLGTEIADGAEARPNTIQMDFHDFKVEWLDSVDFIFSNSFDHAYDPRACLTTWMSCLKVGHICILEHGTAHGYLGFGKTDPFCVDLEHFPFLILEWGKGRFGVREIIYAPHQSPYITCWLIVQRYK